MARFMVALHDAKTKKKDTKMAGYNATDGNSLSKN